MRRVGAGENRWLPETAQDQGNGGGTGGKGAGHSLKENDMVIAHDKKWLEPTRSKMVENLTSGGP